MTRPSVRMHGTLPLVHALMPTEEFRKSELCSFSFANKFLFSGEILQDRWYRPVIPIMNHSPVHLLDWPQVTNCCGINLKMILFRRLVEIEFALES